jgi:hypothetical protein
VRLIERTAGWSSRDTLKIVLESQIAMTHDKAYSLSAVTAKDNVGRLYRAAIIPNAIPRSVVPIHGTAN